MTGVRARLEITASLSGDHGAQNKLDRMEWDALVRQVKALVGRFNERGNLSWIDVTETKGPGWGTR